MGKPSKRSRQRPYWERAYENHGYWRGNDKIGWASLGPDGAGFYRWQTGTHSGSCKTLEEAKRMVELAVEHGASQLGLFDAPDRDAPDRDAPNASDASPSATATAS
jgi:hypothetical protein